MDMEPSADDQPLARYKLHEAASPDKRWTLFIFADRLEFEAADGRWHVVDWDKRHGRVQARDRAFLMRRLLILTVKKKNILFQLDPDAFAKVQAWIGPLTAEDLKVSLKRQHSWVVPIGVLFILTALPIGPKPLEPVTLGLGLGLVLTGTVSRLWPHRVFFLLDSLWFCTLAANSLVMLVNDWGWIRLVFLVLQLHLAWRGFQEFHRFAPNQLAPPEEAGLESA